MSTVTVLDQGLLLPEQSFLPFALTDVLTETAGENDHYFLHFWQLDDVMILGMKDTRVTDLAAGIKRLVRAGLQPIVRNAGGLGVINDQGILNISLILPKEFSIQQAYQAMVELTQQVFPSLAIKIGEISDSYCPGTFDLSVNGQKIAGIAQRRVQKGIAIMMYLSVNGDQKMRGQIVRDFYQASLGENFGKNGYPPVNPASMTTLSAVLGENVTIEEVKTTFQQAWQPGVLKQQPQQWLHAHPEKIKSYQTRIQQMIDRNQIIKELFADDPL